MNCVQWYGLEMRQWCLCAFTRRCGMREQKMKPSHLQPSRESSPASHNMSSSSPFRNFFSNTLISRTPTCIHVPIHETPSRRNSRPGFKPAPREEVLERFQSFGKVTDEMPAIGPDNTIHGPFPIRIREEYKSIINLPAYELTYVSSGTSDAEMTRILDHLRRYQVIGMALLMKKDMPGYMVLYEPVSCVVYAFEIGLIRNRFVVPDTLSTNKMDILDGVRRETRFVHRLLQEYVEESGKVFIGWDMQMHGWRLNSVRQLKPYAIWSPHFLEWDLPKMEEFYADICIDANVLLRLFIAGGAMVARTMWNAFAKLHIAFGVTEHIRKWWNVFHSTGKVNSLYEFLLLTAVRGNADNLTPIPEARELRRSLAQIPVHSLNLPPADMELHASSIKTSFASMPNFKYRSTSDRRNRLLSTPSIAYQPSEIEFLEEQHRAFAKKRVLDSVKPGQNEMHELWLRTLYGMPCDVAVGTKRCREATNFLLGSSEAMNRVTKRRRTDKVDKEEPLPSASIGEAAGEALDKKRAKKKAGTTSTERKEGDVKERKPYLGSLRGVTGNDTREKKGDRRGKKGSEETSQRGRGPRGAGGNRGSKGGKGPRGSE